MTISQCQSKVSFDYDMSNQYSDLNKITKLPKQKLLKGGSTKVAYPFSKHAIDEMVYNGSDTNLTDKTHEIQIPINCANRHKSKKTDSKLMRFFQSISRWRLQSRHLGYYSPRGTNHSIDTINVRLNPAVVAATNNDIHHICEPTLTQFEHGNRYGGNNGHSDRDDDESGGGGGDNNDNHSTISNSSVKEINETAIKDELTAYMDELRLRELR